MSIFNKAWPLLCAGAWAGQAGLRWVAGWAGPEASLSHKAAKPKQACMIKKHFFTNCQHIFDKNGPMELDADEPRKFQGPPDRILGQPT